MLQMTRNGRCHIRLRGHCSTIMAVTVTQTTLNSMSDLANNRDPMLRVK